MKDGFGFACVRAREGELTDAAFRASKTVKGFVDFLAEGNLRGATGKEGLAAGGVAMLVSGKRSNTLELPTNAPWPVVVVILQHLCKQYEATLAGLCMTTVVVTKEEFDKLGLEHQRISAVEVEAVKKVSGTPVLLIYAEDRRGRVACKRLEVVKNSEGKIARFLERKPLSPKDILGFRPIQFFEASDQKPPKGKKGT
jgi:hypothetical protein